MKFSDILHWLSQKKYLDEKVHEAQKPKLLDFRLLLGGVLNLSLLLLFFNFSHQGTKVFAIAILFLMMFSIVGKTFVSSLRWSQACLAQSMMCCTLLMLQLGALFSGGYLHDVKILDQCLGQTVAVTGQVSSSKTVASGGSLVVIEPSRVRCRNLADSQNHPFHTKIRVFLHEDQTHPSSILTLRGKLVRSQGQLMIKSPHHLQVEQAEPNLQEVQKEQVRQQVLSLLPPDNTALLLGLAYGDDSSMTAPTKEDFRVAGLTHLTAVSGSNITLIFLLGFRLGQLLRLNRRALIIGALLMTLAYASLVGWEGSVVRAWTMGMIGVVALLTGSGKSTLPIFSSAIVLLLLLFPELATDLGFLLSTVATASLISIAPSLTRLFEFLVPKLVAEVCAVSISAMLWTAPVLLVMTGKFSTYTVLANICAVPLVPLITAWGLLIFLVTTLELTAIYPALLLVGKWATDPLILISQKISALPYALLEADRSVSFLCLIIIFALGISVLIKYVDAKTKQALLSQGDGVHF